MSAKKLFIFPDKSWICRKKPSDAFLKVSKSSPSVAISKFRYENVAKSKLQSSPHSIVAKYKNQNQISSNQTNSNIKRSQIQNSEIRNSEAQREINHQI